MSFPTPPSNKPATLQTQLRAPSMSRASSNASSSSNQGFDPLVAGFVDPLPGRTQKKLDAIYLDTTYLGPSYCFPAQELVISACAELVKERVVGGDESALWRADGRDGERKGLKGWLARTGDVKDEVKDDEDESSAMMELETLPEDYDEDDLATTMGEETPLRGLLSGPSGLPPIAVAGDEEEEPDEEAWLAAHERPAEAGQEEPSEVVNPQPCSAAPSTDENAVALIKAEEDVCSRGSARQAWEGEDRNPSVKSETDLVGEVRGNADAAQLSSDAQHNPKLDAVKAEDEKPDLKPKKERLLVLVGTYSIGKERYVSFSESWLGPGCELETDSAAHSIVKAIAHALSTKVYCDGYKRSLCLAQDDPDLHALLTEDPLEAQVHIGGLRDITREVMQDYLGKYKAPRIENGFTKMIGLRPTGTHPAVAADYPDADV